MRSLPLRRILILVLGPCMMTGCGVVGAPVPPETVGVAPIIEQQKRLQSQGDTPQPAMDPVPGEGAPIIMGPVGQDEMLPPLRPIGTR